MWCAKGKKHTPFRYLTCPRLQCQVCGAVEEVAEEEFDIFEAQQETVAAEPLEVEEEQLEEVEQVQEVEQIEAEAGLGKPNLEHWTRQSIDEDQQG